jgi:pilus assembly protein CpaC
MAHFLLSIPLVVVLLLSPVSAWARETKTVAEGEQWTEVIKGRVWIEDGEILKATEESGVIRLKALRPGQTEIHIGEKSIWVSVLNRRQNRTWDILKIATTQTLGLSVDVQEGEVAISGNLVRVNDWEILAKHCSQKNCQYKMKAQINESLQGDLQTEIQTKLQKISAYPYLLEFSENLSIHLPPKLPQIEKVAVLLAKYGVEIVTDLSSLELQPLVKVQITVAEIKKSEAFKYGIEWAESYKAQLVPNNPEGQDPLIVSLHAMEKTGSGKVLASPNILCRSGKEAEFLAGGEFPIKIINSKMQDIVWKRYGILLRVKPLADFSGRMSISLETEISSIDPDRTVDGIPGTFMNRLQSHFDLTSPQTIALSGLIKNESSEARGGIPGLARIPILGALFSSTDYRKNQSELVIFVRPEIIHPNQLSQGH